MTEEPRIDPIDDDDPAGEIILDGQRYGVSAKTCLWTEHGMTWTRAPNVIARELEPNIILWHWTGGENSAETFYGTLINRNLGVTFYIDCDGLLWQFVDPVIYDPKDTGGGIGRRSISIEVANYGFLWPQPKTKTGRGSDRVVDAERIHGQHIEVARFYDHQVTVVAALTKVLCSALNIPLRFPRDDSGAILTGEMPPRMARSFTGVAGHLHKTDQKYDPGLQIFRDLEHLESDWGRVLVEQEG